MGLAISLVSTCKEKVWYHTCKSKGADCQNRKLVTEGGCGLWYDEPTLLLDLEKLLGKTIQRLRPDLSLAIAKKAYGTELIVDPEQERHSMLLLPVLEQLAILEVQTQRSFLQFQTRFPKTDAKKSKP